MYAAFDTFGAHTTGFIYHALVIQIAGRAVVTMQAIFDVRLLDSTYSVEKRGEGNDEVIVKLFGKTRDNQSITIRCPDFKPYFHVFDPPPELRKAFETSNDVLNEIGRAHV